MSNSTLAVCRLLESTLDWPVGWMFPDRVRAAIEAARSDVRAACRHEWSEQHPDLGWDRCPKCGLGKIHGVPASEAPRLRWVVWCNDRPIAAFGEEETANGYLMQRGGNGWEVREDVERQAPDVAPPFSPSKAEVMRLADKYRWSSLPAETDARITLSAALDALLADRNHWRAEAQEMRREWESACERDRNGQHLLGEAVARAEEAERALGEDAAGRPFASLLSVAADLLHRHGGGPVEQCLRLKAEQLAALKEPRPADAGGTTDECRTGSGGPTGEVMSGPSRAPGGDSSSGPGGSSPPPSTTPTALAALIDVLEAMLAYHAPHMNFKIRNDMDDVLRRARALQVVDVAELRALKKRSFGWSGEPVVELADIEAVIARAARRDEPRNQ